MKAASNLIMWLAMVLLVSLAMVLGLVLLLLAELYCSPLVNRHRHLQPTTATATGNNSDGCSQSQSDASPSPLNSTPTDTNDDIEKQLHQQSENQDSGIKVEIGKGYSGDSVNGCSTPIVYISNPIYDDENGKGSTVADDDDDKTPFETPDTSPSRLETEDFSGDEEISSSTPPMKKLPAVVGLVGTWGSDTNSNNGVSSSSSLSTPSTSPSL